MFIARLKDKYSSEYDAICSLYDDNEISIFYAATFSPDIEYKILQLKISGKTYAERKNAARQLAIDYQYLTDCGGLSMMELSRIYNYFISEYECYFFGMYNEYNARYNDDTVTYYYSMRYNTDDIINNIAADFNVDPANVVFNSCY